MAGTIGTVREAMTASPTCVTSTSTLVEAAKLMQQGDVGSLPVVDGDRLVGIVTDRDLVVRGIARGADPSSTRVEAVCSRGPASVSPDEQLDAALQRMAREQVRRLPVVEDGRVVGIIAQADVARSASEQSTGAMVEEISKR
jgi:CBS domain-containing protein